ncbi:unnamed protein product, partial [Ectocarpus sp. 12 AP-2014]
RDRLSRRRRGPQRPPRGGRGRRPAESGGRRKRCRGGSAPRAPAAVANIDRGRSSVAVRRRSVNGDESYRCQRQRRRTGLASIAVACERDNDGARRRRRCRWARSGRPWPRRGDGGRRERRDGSRRRRPHRGVPQGPGRGCAGVAGARAEPVGLEARRGESGPGEDRGAAHRARSARGSGGNAVALG